jgi:hypothetical protein
VAHRGGGGSALARRTIAIAMALALVCVLALALSGCGQSPRGNIVGTWVTGKGPTGGEMTFTGGGVMTQAHNPPVKYVLRGDDVYLAGSGEETKIGAIEWVNSDRIIYTTLTIGCSGLTLTYDRKK